MRLTLERRFRGTEYTIGRLSVDGKYLCDTLEDADRGLDDGMSEAEIRAKKVYGRTAIPTGEYEVTIDTVSPRFSTKASYKQIKGKLPRLLNVKGFDGILIHCGNTASDSHGCILVGQNNVKGKVLNSTRTFYRLYPLLQRARAKGEKITIKIY